MTSNTTGWGFFQQGSDQMQEVYELGEELSRQLSCPVHYPAWGKHQFECICGVLFPVYAVRARDWEFLRKHHKEGFRPERR